MPVGKKGVDNYHAGGVAAAVDVESGTIGRGIGSRGLDWLDTHPETKRVFTGLTVPGWDDVLRITRRAAASMPEFPCVGWDLAVTPSGPILIEANSVWGTDIVQRPHRRGIWEGDFRDWCLAQMAGKKLNRQTKRWLGIS